MGTLKESIRKFLLEHLTDNNEDIDTVNYIADGINDVVLEHLTLVALRDILDSKKE
jgi:hypothetical protein